MMFIKGQLMVHAKPYKEKIVEVDGGEILTYYFETNYKKYGRVLTFVEFFNARMKHADTVKYTRKLAAKYNATITEDDNRFFDRPANVDVSEYPTSEEIAEANTTWRCKISKMVKRLKVKYIGESVKP